MGIKKRRICSFCAIALALFLCGCSAGAENGSQSTEINHTTVTITAAFQREDGTALSNDTIRFSDSENSVDYVLDENGTLVLSGLPREGELMVTVLDQQAQPQGAIALSFAQGSVIDVVTSEDGTGHITLKEDTEELTLNFTLLNNGSMECALQLTRSRVA